MIFYTTLSALFPVKNEVVIHVVLRHRISLAYAEGIWNDVFEVEGVVVLRLPEPRNAHIILYAIHAEMFIEVGKISLQGPVIEIGAGIVAAIDTEIMIGIGFEIGQRRKQDSGKYS